MRPGLFVSTSKDSLIHTASDLRKYCAVIALYRSWPAVSQHWRHTVCLSTRSDLVWKSTPMVERIPLN